MDSEHYAQTVYNTVEGLIIASRKAYEFIGFLIIMFKNHIKTYGFEHDDQKVYKFI